MMKPRSAGQRKTMKASQTCKATPVDKPARRRKALIPKRSMDFPDKTTPQIDVSDQLDDICRAFGGVLSHHQSSGYVHCPSLLRLFPDIKLTNRSSIVRAVQEMFEACGFPEELRMLHCLDLAVDEDVWMKVEAYLLILIRSYKEIKQPDKLGLKELVSVYINMCADGDNSLVKLLTKLKLNRKKSLKKSTPKQSTTRGFPAAEWSSVSARSCSSQTDGSVQASYINTLSLKQQLSSPSVIRKLAWIIQHDRKLNDIFWQAYNTGSGSTINRVPGILSGDTHMISDVSTQTEAPCVPVLELNRLNANQRTVMNLNPSDLAQIQNSSSASDDILDFVPNLYNDDKMDELFHNINANSYGPKWRAAQLRDLVSSEGVKLSHHQMPSSADVIKREEGASYNTRTGSVKREMQGKTDCMGCTIAGQLAECEGESYDSIDMECDVDSVHEPNGSDCEYKLSGVDSDYEPGHLDVYVDCNMDTSAMSDKSSKSGPKKPKVKKEPKTSRAKTKKNSKQPSLRNDKEAQSGEINPSLLKEAPRERLCCLCDKVITTPANQSRCCSSHRNLLGTKDYRSKKKKDYMYSYSCPYCTLTNPNLIKVKSHVLMIHKQTNSDYVCDVCGKSLADKEKLLRHKASHMTVKPYVCETCGKDFSQSNNLNAHRRQHTGEKPFQCEHCGNSFTHNVSLRKHFCKTLGRRIEPCDQKMPGIGRPAKEKSVPCRPQ